MATYGKTTMTTYKGTSDEVLVLCGDSEINEYFLNNIITVTGAYIFTVWYKSETSASITFNVFGEEETVESTTVWHKYVKRIDVETLTNDDISITVTPEVNTYFYEAFCVNGRADTSWYPSDLDIDAEVKNAAKSATNFITEIGNGIWVTPANARPDSDGEPLNSTSGWRLSSALDLFLQGISHFRVWIENGIANVRVGIESAGHLLLQPSVIQLKSDADTVVAQFQAPSTQENTLGEYVDIDRAASITINNLIGSLEIPSNCTVSNVSCWFTDELMDMYTISQSSVYDSSDYETYFRYSRSGTTISVYANGTFSMPFATTISIVAYVSTVISHNYIGSNPDSPNNYLLSIGNGMSSSSPHNALSMDWRGNIEVPDGFIQGRMKQNILWSGGYYMTASHTARLSEPISEQSNGIVLLWSGYNNGSPMNAHWVSYFIPRTFVQPPYTGQGFCIPLVSSNLSNVGMKYVYVYDNQIVGNDDNSATGTASGITYKNNHWVLRFIIGV